MKQLLTIASFLLCSIALPVHAQNTETWKGTLLDASCKEVRDEAEQSAMPAETKNIKDPNKALTPAKRSFENCRIKAKTATFALMSGGKIFKFDEASNTELRSQLKDSQKVNYAEAVLVSV